jgi:hypothetical protein
VEIDLQGLTEVAVGAVQAAVFPVLSRSRTNTRSLLGLVMWRVRPEFLRWRRCSQFLPVVGVQVGVLN